MTGQVTEKPSWVSKTNRAMAALIVLLSVAWTFDVPTYLGYAFYLQQFLALVLGLAGAITFLANDWRGQRRQRPPIPDIGLAAVFLLAMCYVSLNYADLLMATAMRPTKMIVLGIVILACVLEAIRRRAGTMLFVIILGFVLYGLLAHVVPAPLTGRRMTWETLPLYLSFDASAILGLPLRVASTVVIIFVLFGEVLFRAGGGAFFTDFAISLVGRRQGGPAKIAIVSSAFFGSISGSAVSNVASTGLVTIPLMRRSGMKPTEAGAIEAVASTGGQFLPPIMGAAAFLMAEFTNIDYSEIIVAALVPALLYYFAVFYQVHLLAGRDRLAPVEHEIPRPGQVLRDGWQFLAPFVLLIFFIFTLNWSAQRAAMVAGLAMAALGMLFPYKGQRARLAHMKEAWVKAGFGSVELLMIVAGAGVVIGILNSSGGGFALTLALVQLGGENLMPLLLIGALICIVLGMGMPTAGVYVLLAALVAPAIVETGVPLLSAHMFVLYFGMMSMITPPIALACFAAATITEESPLKIGVAAVRFGWVAYIIPFLFVVSPALLLIGSAIEITVAVATAALGVALVTIAIVGFFKARLSTVPRLLFGVVGLVTMMPSGTIEPVPHLDLIGAALAVPLIFLFGRPRSAAASLAQD